MSGGVSWCLYCEGVAQVSCGELATKCQGDYANKEGIVQSGTRVLEHRLTDDLWQRYLSESTSHS